MTRLSISILAAGLLAAAPALACDKHEKKDHANHSAAHTHAHHTAVASDTATTKPATMDLAEAVATGGEVVEVKILGMVCDFCATALSKTFGKRAEVNAIDVNLDTKLLTVVMEQGQTLDDASIEKLVVNAGYKIQSIERNAGAAPVATNG